MPALNENAKYKHLICQGCGTEFTSKTRNTAQKYCTKSCAGKFSINSSKFKKGDVSWNKGTNISGMSGKYHSLETKIKMGLAITKEFPVSSANKLARLSPEYKEWRRLVFIRDNHECRQCGSKERIHPHHIEPFSKNIELRYVVSNGLTLCELCHGKVHGVDFSIYRKKLTCHCCGEKFVPKDGHYKQKTCSKDCKYKLMKLLPSKTKGVPRPHTQRARIANCQECGVEFRAVKDTHKRQQKFCGSSCYLKNRWGYTGLQATLEATGQTFDELKEAVSG